MGKQKTKGILIECVAMILLAFLLSNIVIIKMPYGGKVTAASMFPIIILSYRQGLKWGLGSGLVYSLLQLLMGMDKLSDASNTIGVLEIAFFDYIIAFTVLGIVGWWKRERPQTSTLIIGGVFVCFLRFLSHVMSGATVWAGVSVPTTDGMIHSLTYNGAYMVPETIVTVYVIAFISLSANLRLDKPELVQKKLSTTELLYSLLFFGIAIVADFIYLFGKIQNKDGYDITQVMDADPMILGIITVGGIAVSVIVYFLLHVILDDKKIVNK